jgi:prefoldin subunit 5
MLNLNEAKTSVQEISEMQRLVEELTKATYLTQELSYSIKASAKTLRKMPSIPEKDDVQEQVERTPEDAMTVLWERISYINKTNSELQKTADHLRSVVGY